MSAIRPTDPTLEARARELCDLYFASHGLRVSAWDNPAIHRLFYHEAVRRLLAGKHPRPLLYSLGDPQRDVDAVAALVSRWRDEDAARGGEGA